MTPVRGDGMVVRGLDAGDLPQLLRFERRYMQTFEPNSLPGWTAALDRNLQLWIDCLPTSAVLVGQGEAVLGLALWQLHAPVATLVTIHVSPEQQRRGLGGTLLDVFVAAARSAGMGRAALGVHQDNLGAESLYLRHGFRRVGVDGDYRLYEQALEHSGTD